MAMYRTWMWTAAALVLITGITVLLVIESRAGAHAVRPAAAPASPAPADSQPAVRLSAPAAAGPPREPQANLLQPVPTPPAAPPAPVLEAGADRTRHVTAARWPLAAPAAQEPPPAEGPPSGTPAVSWSRPLPLETPPPALADGAGAAEVIRPMPALAAAPRPRPSSRARPLPLTGTYSARLEGSGTLALPADLRKQLKGQAGRPVFVTPGPDACLYLYTVDGLQRWNEQLEQAAGGTDRVRGARRLSLAQTEACTLDRSGRLRVPEHLARFAGLRQDVVLIGVGDHLEAWDAGRWQQYRQHPRSAGSEEACEP